MVSSVALPKWCLGKVFRPTPKVLNCNWSTDYFRLLDTHVMILYTGFTHILYVFIFYDFFNFLMLQARIFMVYSVHSLSMWYTYSLTFPHFQVRYRCCFYRSCSSGFVVKISESLSIVGCLSFSLSTGRVLWN